ncbi:DUF3592 domain-containing protein [Herbidospora daliensis]|uniref:DUF3592 domain-containing protein n=1 Tax=Herbidospora daliensis TaxID=295585 RepID=UPI0007829B26|nr:DUF3592 domain-containing protein [Herbidospora daliensis]
MIATFFRQHVLPWTLGGLALLGLAAWLYADQTAFSRRAVVAAGKVTELQRGGVQYSHDGQPGMEYHGRVSYMVDGVEVVSRMRLEYCSTTRCDPPQPGSVVTVAYDPQQPGRAVLSSAEGLPTWPIPNLVSIFLLVIGLVSLAAVVINVVWIWPVVRARPVKPG